MEGIVAAPRRRTTRINGANQFRYLASRRDKLRCRWKVVNPIKNPQYKSTLINTDGHQFSHTWTSLLQENSFQRGITLSPAILHVNVLFTPLWLLAMIWLSVNFSLTDGYVNRNRFLSWLSRSRLLTCVLSLIARQLTILRVNAHSSWNIFSGKDHWTEPNRASYHHRWSSAMPLCIINLASNVLATIFLPQCHRYHDFN